MSQTNPSDNPSTYDIALAVYLAQRGDMRTTTPAKVVKYYPSEGSIDAQICIRGSKEDPETHELLVDDPPPIVVNVHVMWPGNKRSRIVWDLQPDDDVILHFSDRSLDEWRSVPGKDFTPADRTRRFNVADAFATPVWGSGADTLAATAYASGAVVMSGSDLRLVGSDAIEAYVLHSKLRMELDALWAALQAHVHPGVVAGPAATGAPTVVAVKQNLRSQYIKGK